MHLLRLLKTASAEANLLAISSIGLLLVKVFILNKIPEIFNGAHYIGVIFEGLLASVIASYIFYIIVVHIKEFSDRETLHPYISKHSKRIVGACNAQLNDISKTSGEALSLESINTETMKLAFSKIAPYSKAPLMIDYAGTYANWFQYFNYHNTRSQNSIRKLLNQLPFLQAAHISMISEIDDCHHFWMHSSNQQIIVRNTDLSNWSDTFYKYCVLCQELSEYNKKLDATVTIPNNWFKSFASLTRDRLKPAP